MSSSTGSLAVSSLFSVQGKIVLVTGGGTGIGRMIATTFAVNGSTVYITGRRKDVLDATAEEINAQVKEQSGTGKVISIQGDVSSKAKVKEFHAQIAAQEEKLDVLINCAGVLIPFRSKATDHNDDAGKRRGVSDTLGRHAASECNLPIPPVNSEDIAIQSSSKYHPAQKVVTATEDFTFAVNVAGPYFVTTAFAPMLMKSDNASVINIASIGAFALQK
ncbi:hypothetical protein QFC19_000455 [Naganishia cerealis]|uniref:Uncharacterized protein n=1 Tax=Naganishia cerealis TaxID=610337 RepID=A0ACC2WMB7_9TREE|nr:hypothetical protein QFC19_000455 [Naganishia cerealis]